MEKLLLSSLGVVCLLIFTLPLFGQLELGFETEFTDEDKYCATLLLKSAEGNEQAIGTSSFFVEYNKEALKFDSYTSKSFDQNNKCVNDQVAPYTNHNFDASYPGIINTTIFLKNPKMACPTVDDDGLEIATVCFTITDNKQSSELKYNPEFTNLDKATLKVELFKDMQFRESDDPLNGAITK